LRAALALLLATIALSSVAPSPAFACSCAALSTSQSVDGADAVFLGTATADGVHVDEVFKGMLPSRVALDGSPDPCPSGLVTGQQYVVFATWHADGQRWSTDPCAGTASATPALVAEVERVAGDGRPPYDVPGGLPDDTAEHGLGTVAGWVWLLLGTGAVAVLVLGIAGVAVVRGNRASG
jgi:hypothetical protein